MSTLQTLFFEDASEFIETIPEPDKAKVLAAIKMMETDFEVVKTKTLRHAIKELIVKKYRIVFFMKGRTIYFVLGFVKKSQKTPKYEIDRAEAVYKKM
jgi:phage-related protein